MKQFMGGFVVASMVWVGVLCAQSYWNFKLFDFLFASDTEASQSMAELEMGPTVATKKKQKGSKKRGWRKRSRGQRSSKHGQFVSREYDMSEGIKGDVLGGPGSRDLNMAGGGQVDQLSSAEIDQGIGRVFKGIERCLLLLPSDAPAQGKVIFGMKIAKSGHVTKVNLKGPNTMIQGETGACFRRKVKSIKYRPFDGPDMIAHYPIVFE